MDASAAELLNLLNTLNAAKEKIQPVPEPEPEPVPEQIIFLWLRSRNPDAPNPMVYVCKGKDESFRRLWSMAPSMSLREHFQQDFDPRHYYLQWVPQQWDYPQI
jgi:hypothetical protein